MCGRGGGLLDVGDRTDVRVDARAPGFVDARVDARSRTSASMWSNASTPSMPSAEELRAAYAAKQRVDAMADYASRAAAGAREGVASALASARTGASARGYGA